MLLIRQSRSHVSLPTLRRRQSWKSCHCQRYSTMSRLTPTEDHMYDPPEVTFHLELIIIIAINPCSGAGKNWNHVTIEPLPDDTLLEIFDLYQVDAVAHSRGPPWKWHRLAHICRRWRSIVYTSPRRLCLQILCRNGAPIERVLGAWSTLPLLLRFKGNARSKSLPNNVMIALRHSDRVCEIDLSLTSSIIRLIAEHRCRFWH